MGYRLMGYTHRQIAKQMDWRPRLSTSGVSAGLPSITQQTAEESRRVMMEQCHQIIQKLMPLMDETAPKDILGGILKVRQQQMKLGSLQGSGGISVSIGNPARATATRTSSCASRPMRRCFA